MVLIFIIRRVLLLLLTLLLAYFTRVVVKKRHTLQEFTLDIYKYYFVSKNSYICWSLHSIYLKVKDVDLMLLRKLVVKFSLGFVVNV